MKFCVIGLGRFGYQVAKTLSDNGNEVLGVDANQMIIQEIKNDITQALCLRIDDQHCLVSIGVQEMDVVIVAVGENFAQAVLITALLKKRLSIRTVITRAINTIHQDILLLIGADRVILPEQEIGKKLADSLSSLPYAHLTRLTAQFGISYNGVPSKFIGRSLQEVPLFAKFGVQCIGIIDNHEIQHIDPDHIFQQDDAIVYSGPIDKLANLPPLTKNDE